MKSAWSVVAAAVFAMACGGISSESPGEIPGAGDELGGPKDPWQLSSELEADVTDEKGALAFGQTLKTVAIAKKHQHKYTFEALAGAKIQITMIGDSGLDTFLQLRAPNGALFEDDDAAGGGNAELTVNGLPAAGTYTLFAATYRHAGTGTYTLSMSCTGPGACVNAPQPPTPPTPPTPSQDTVDNDFDGFAEIAGDCDDTSANVSPKAPEVPLNTRDDNCDGVKDEGCNDPAACNRPPKVPVVVSVKGRSLSNSNSYCRVEARSEPNAKLTVLNQSTGQTLLDGYAMGDGGTFNQDLSTCRMGDTLVLSVQDARGAQSGRVWARVPGADVSNPSPVTSAVVKDVGAGVYEVNGVGELWTTLSVVNMSQANGPKGTGKVTAGFSGGFSVPYMARPGDWMRVQQADDAGNNSDRVYVRTPGTDTSAPELPTVVSVKGRSLSNSNSYCRLELRGESHGKLTVTNQSTRQPLVTDWAFDGTAYINQDLSTCRMGDVLVITQSDGTNRSGEVVTTVPGQDVSNPSTVSGQTVTRIGGGMVRVSASIEINGVLRIVNSADGKEYLSPTTSTGSVTLDVFAFVGDQLQIYSLDAARLSSTAVTVSAP